MPILPAMIHLTAASWIWAVVLLAVALAAIVLYYRRTVPPVHMPLKIPLAALRVIATLALFLSLADALLSSIRSERAPLELLVLLDHSGSMGEADGGNADREARARQYLKEQIADRLGDRVRVQELIFDDHILDPKIGRSDSLGAATAIGDVLGEVGKRIPELGPPRACVLLSDGANNRGVDPAAAASRLGYPVVAVGFGQVGGPRAQVVALDAPEVVFTGRSFDVNVALQGGTPGAAATMRLTTAGRTLDQKSVTLAGAGERVPVSMKAQIESPGRHDLRVDVVGADGQVVPAVGRTVLVRALKGRLKVFLLGFELDWEYSTLRRWLARQSQVELLDHVMGKPSVGSPLPTAAEWDNMDVVIFIHPSRDELRTVWAPHVAAMSKPGKGVIFLLNDRFADAAAAPPPVPLEFCRGALAKPHGEFASEPSATRQNHPLVRLDPNADWEGTRRLWTERPPWAGLIVFDTLPAGCDVLVRSGATASGSDAPAIWTRPLRPGRSLTLTANPMWRWVAENAAKGLAPEQYNAFWTGALRWVTLSDDADRLAVRPDLEIYHSGEPVQLEGLVFDEAYRFLDRAEVTARVWPDSAARDTMHVFLNPGVGDRFVGRLGALPPGTYRYDGQAQFEGAAQPLSGGMFRVEPYSLEQQFSGLDDEQLRAIARESGGRYYPESSPPYFLDSLDWTPLVHERRLEIQLGNHWLVLTIFIAALSVEWFIRRRRQLL